MADAMFDLKPLKGSKKLKKDKKKKKKELEGYINYRIQNNLFPVDDE